MRNLKICFILTTSIITNSLFAQYKISRADSALMAGNNRLAITLYFQQGQKGIDDNSLNLAEAYTILGNKDSAFYYLKRQKDLWGLPVMLLSSPIFATLHETPEWIEITRDVEKKYFEENPKFIKDLVKELWQMGIDDQYYRGDITDFIKTYGSKSQKVDSIQRLQKNLDSVNLAKLEKIVLKYGWPKISEVGDMTSSVPFLIIQHTTDLNIQKKYLKIIGGSIKINEADPKSYAYLTDRILMKENKKQVYGTQMKFNDKTGKNELYPIEDEANVDKRRADLGMEPLKDYLNMMGIQYEKK